MTTHESANNGYCINGFMHFSDLAVNYFPELSTPSSASRKLRSCIKDNDELYAQMSAAGYTKTTFRCQPEDATHPLPVFGSTRHQTADNCRP